MNVVGKISLGVTAAVLVLNQGLRAEDAVLASAATDASQSSEPYSTIVARNIFGLVPIPPPPPPQSNEPPADPPPKITANGIMSIFGQLEALFKVTLPAKAGAPAKETSYTLSEGERQDDIEVVKIDEKAATITFNNHGTTQEIPLVAGQATTSGAPAAGGGPPAPQNPFAPRLPRFGNRPAGFSGGGNLGSGGQVPSPQGNNNNNNPSSTPAFGGDGNPALANPYLQQNLTPEQQVLGMELQRELLKEQGASAPYPPNLLPPTVATPKAPDNP